MRVVAALLVLLLGGAILPAGGRRSAHRDTAKPVSEAISGGAAGDAFAAAASRLIHRAPDELPPRRLTNCRPVRAALRSRRSPLSHP